VGYTGDTAVPAAIVINVVGVITILYTGLNLSIPTTS
jgi:hypothetical protein